MLSAPSDPQKQDFDAANSLGNVTALIVPNFGHRAGLDVWLAHCPQAEVYAPSATVLLAERSGMRDLKTLADLQTDETISIVEIPGARTGGTFLSISRGARPVVYVDEVLVTMQKLPGSWLYRQLFRWKRVKPGIAVNRIYTDWMTRDRKQVATTALSLLDGNPICFAAHGPPIESRSDLSTARALLQSLL